MIDPRTIFDYVENFDESENWGNLTKVNPLLILTLNYIRKYINTPIHINCVYEKSGHSATSQHYKGNAVDFYLGSFLKFYDQINLMERTLIYLNLDDRVGFGIYPYWNTPGFHLDIRGEKARWGRDSKGEYVGYDAIKYEII